MLWLFLLIPIKGNKQKTGANKGTNNNEHTNVLFLLTSLAVTFRIVECGINYVEIIVMNAQARAPNCIDSRNGFNDTGFIVQNNTTVKPKDHKMIQ